MESWTKEHLSNFTRELMKKKALKLWASILRHLSHFTLTFSLIEAVYFLYLILIRKVRLTSVNFYSQLASCHRAIWIQDSILCSRCELIAQFFFHFSRFVLRCDLSNDGYIDQKEFSNWITMEVRFPVFHLSLLLY